MRKYFVTFVLEAFLKESLRFYFLFYLLLFFLLCRSFSTDRKTRFSVFFTIFPLDLYAIRFL